jgi:hypothetical protein
VSFSLGRSTLAGAGVVALLAALPAGGCGLFERTAERSLTLKQGVPVNPGETKPDVRAKWGPPARTVAYSDPLTGVREEAWEYEQYSDVDRAIVTTRVLFANDRVSKVEREVFRQTDQEIAPDRRDRP